MIFLYFALVCSGIVSQVIVASQEEVKKPHRQKQGCEWVETTTDGSKGKNFAGIGYTLDPEARGFVPPKRKGKESWTLNKETAKWEPPVPYPSDGKDYAWNEEKQKWEIRQSKP